MTTALESVEHLQRFVDANLAMGVDHLFIVVDWPDLPGQAEVVAHFTRHPQVTVIVGDDQWWPHQRPPGINRRQIVNANRVLRALGAAQVEAWLFHIDSDEVLALGDDGLDDLPETVQAVKLEPLETVSTWLAPSYETRFKRMPGPDEGLRMTRWGVIEHPDRLHAYFKGHRGGKVGVRVGAGIRLGIHHALTPAAERLPLSFTPDKYLLHYHTRSGAQAVEKALAMALNPQVRYGDRKHAWIAAVRTLAAEYDRAVLLTEARTVFEELGLADRPDLLERHGLLIHVDPREHTRTPTPFPAAALARVRELLGTTLPGRPLRLFFATLPPQRPAFFGRFGG